MRNWRCLTAHTLAAAMLFLPGCFQPIFASVASTEMVAILRNAKVVKPGCPLRVNLTDGEALIATERNIDTSDQNCKVMAILLAKALVDAYPADVLRVKVLFSDSTTGKYSQVAVSKGDIEAYGDGKIGQEDFLKSIEISSFEEKTSPFNNSTGDSSTQLTIAPGVMQDKRLMLLSRIQNMKAKGTNVKMFMDYFNSIEDRVKAGDDAQVGPMINSLSNKITEQDKSREQAHETQIKYDVLAFQTELSQYMGKGKSLPFNPGVVMTLQQLVVQGRYAEASQLMAMLRQKMHGKTAH